MSAPHEHSVSGWRRLRSVLAPRKNRSQVIVFLLCVVLGLFVAVQLQSTQDELDQLSEENLVRLLDESGRAVDNLEGENAELDRQLRELRSVQADDAAAREAAQERLETLRILAGTAPAEGPGVVITIRDPKNTVTDAALLSIIQELRNAGAEVIEVGGVRIVASSWVARNEQGLVVDGHTLDRPVTIRAIGDADVIQPALLIPGGAADTVSAAGGTLSSEAQDSVTISSLTDKTDMEYASVVK